MGRHHEQAGCSGSAGVRPDDGPAHALQVTLTPALAPRWVPAGRVGAAHGWQQGKLHRPLLDAHPALAPRGVPAGRVSVRLAAVLAAQAAALLRTCGACFCHLCLQCGSAGILEDLVLRQLWWPTCHCRWCAAPSSNISKGQAQHPASSSLLTWPQHLACIPAPCALQPRRSCRREARVPPGGRPTRGGRRPCRPATRDGSSLPASSPQPARVT